MKKARKRKQYFKKKFSQASQEKAFRLLVRILSKKYKIQYASM